MRAGARDTIYYNPAEVNVAIVTCGGLCPGLNDVVLGLVNKLTDYGVPEGHILGIRCVLAPYSQLLHGRSLLATGCREQVMRFETVATDVRRRIAMCHSLDEPKASISYRRY